MSMKSSRKPDSHSLIRMLQVVCGVKTQASPSTTPLSATASFTSSVMSLSVSPPAVRISRSCTKIFISHLSRSSLQDSVAPALLVSRAVARASQSRDLCSMRPILGKLRADSPFQGFAALRRIADAVEVKVGRSPILVAVGLISVLGVFLFVRRTGTSVLTTAATPDWALLVGGLAICAAVQPLRAWAWSSTVRSPVGFRAMYAASSIGSFLDTVLPGRLGEASKVAVLKVAAGPRWPGISRAGGSLLCAHLLEMIAFAVLGAAATLFLPVPAWARWTMVAGIAGAAGAIALASVLHRQLGCRLPQGVTAFLAGAAAPRGVLLRAG